MLVSLRHAQKQHRRYVAYIIISGASYNVLRAHVASLRWMTSSSLPLLTIILPARERAHVDSNRATARSTHTRLTSLKTLSLSSHVCLIDQSRSLYRQWRRGRYQSTIQKNDEPTSQLCYSKILYVEQKKDMAKLCLPCLI